MAGRSWAGGAPGRAQARAARIYLAGARAASEKRAGRVG